MYTRLAVTCHLHFWQNDQDLLRATAVTRGWNGYRNKSQHRKLTLEKKILLQLLLGLEPGTFRSRQVIIRKIEKCQGCQYLQDSIRNRQQQNQMQMKKMVKPTCTMYGQWLYFVTENIQISGRNCLIGSFQCCFTSTETVRTAQDNRLDFHTTQQLSSSSMLSYVHRETNNIKITQMEKMVKPTCAMYGQWLLFATEYPNLRQKLFDWFLFNASLRPQRPYGLL